jgi:hypothetical protein
VSLREESHSRTHECKWSLLKVKEGKYKREQVESGGREREEREREREREREHFSSPGAFKTYKKQKQKKKKPCTKACTNGSPVILAIQGRRDQEDHCLKPAQTNSS